MFVSPFAAAAAAATDTNSHVQQNYLRLLSVIPMCYVDAHQKAGRDLIAKQLKNNNHRTILSLPVNSSMKTAPELPVAPNQFHER